MKAGLLISFLWYEDISPEALSDALGITQTTLFSKFFKEKEFTLEEIRQITRLLGLSQKEVEAIFFD